MRSTKRKEAAWECFFCVLHTCNGLICSLQSRLCIFFPFWSIQHPKKNKNKQETQKPHQIRTPTQETKNQRHKTNCTLKTGENAENWVPLCFLFCCFVCFLGFLVFLVPCFFWRAGRKKKWQDLTFCYFSQLRVCKFGFCYCLLWVCGFMTKLRQNHRKM